MGNWTRFPSNLPARMSGMVWWSCHGGSLKHCSLVGDGDWYGDCPHKHREPCCLVSTPCCGKTLTTWPTHSSPPYKGPDPCCHVWRCLIHWFPSLNKWHVRPCLYTRLRHGSWLSLGANRTTVIPQMVWETLVSCMLTLTKSEMTPWSCHESWHLCHYRLVPHPPTRVVIVCAWRPTTNDFVRR